MRRDRLHPLRQVAQGGLVWLQIGNVVGQQITTLARLRVTDRGEQPLVVELDFLGTYLRVAGGRELLDCTVRHDSRADEHDAGHHHGRADNGPGTLHSACSSSSSCSSMGRGSIAGGRSYL